MIDPLTGELYWSCRSKKSRYCSICKELAAELANYKRGKPATDERPNDTPPGGLFSEAYYYMQHKRRDRFGRFFGDVDTPGRIEVSRDPGKFINNWGDVIFYHYAKEDVLKVTNTKETETAA